VRYVFTTIGIVAAVYATLCGALFTAMLQPPARFAGVMNHAPWPAIVILPFRPLWNVARSGPTIVGEAAPDFDLETTDLKDHFRLSSLRGQKPVALVFGSYT
jgi:hypothetical protein